MCHDHSTQILDLVTTQAIHFSNAKRAIPSPLRGEGIARFARNTDSGLSSYWISRIMMRIPDIQRHIHRHIHRQIFRLLLIGMLLFMSMHEPIRSIAQLSDYTLPPGFVMHTIASGLDRPTAIDFLPDGELLITEQAGFVKLLTPTNMRSETVLDLSGEVNGIIERGMTGIAVDPNFTSNGHIFLLYTYDSPGEERSGNDLRRGHLVRYTMRERAVDAGSRKVILEGFESDVPFHSAGTVRFGTDGMLYASFGDSSNPYVLDDLALRSQNLNRLQGKIVRITADGAAPPSNPYYDPSRPNDIRSKVYAYGFRNPFRFRAHPQTGTLYVGNVGWQTTESLVRVEPGANFGWPCFESVRPVAEFASTEPCTRLKNDALLAAEFDYLHNGDTASITAGDFAGEGFPPTMRGDFFFGDYAKKWIRRAVLDAAGAITRVENFGEGLGFPVDIGFGPDGALYLVDYLGGAVKRISYEPTRRIPTATLRATEANGQPLDTIITGAAPLDVTFSAAGSADPDGGALRYVWSFSVDTALVTTAQPTVTFTYENPGDYLATLHVIDADEWVASTALSITVRATGPLPRITSHLGDETIYPGELVTITGTAIGIDGGKLPAQQLTWTIEHFDEWHRRLITTGEGSSISFVMPGSSPSARPQSLDATTSVAVTLAATDTSSRSSRTRVVLHPMPHDGYIRTWWIIDGFPNRSLADEVLPVGEAFHLPQRTNGARLIRSASRKIDLTSVAQPTESSLAYAFIWLHAPSARTALLGMSSDDGIAVWLNGAEVWRNPTARYVTDDTRDLDLPKVQLRAGSNALLIKIDQKLGEWAFKLRVLNQNGSVMNDVTATAGR